MYQISDDGCPLNKKHKFPLETFSLSLKINPKIACGVCHCRMYFDNCNSVYYMMPGIIKINFSMGGAYEGGCLFSLFCKNTTQITSK